MQKKDTIKYHLILTILILSNFFCFTSPKQVKQDDIKVEIICNHIKNKLIEEFGFIDGITKVNLVIEENINLDFIFGIKNCLKTSFLKDKRIVVSEAKNCKIDKNNYCITLQNMLNHNDYISFDYILGNQSESILFRLEYNKGKNKISLDKFDAIIVK